MNERIRAREVRLIGPDGDHIGIVAVQDALTRAREATLDLVEISDKSDPPVCRIMDYGQFRYQKAKKQKDSRKKLKKIVVKEVKMRPRIGQHDFVTKLHHAQEFLEHGDKVKFLIQFRGRENAHREIGMTIMQRVITELDGIGTVEMAPRQEGQFLNMVMAPDAAMLRRIQKETKLKEPEQAKLPPGEEDKNEEDAAGDVTAVEADDIETAAEAVDN